jgi:hypothetical protein
LPRIPIYKRRNQWCGENKCLLTKCLDLVVLMEHLYRSLLGHNIWKFVQAYRWFFLSWKDQLAEHKLLFHHSHPEKGQSNDNQWFQAHLTIILLNQNQHQTSV